MQRHEGIAGLDALPRLGVQLNPRGEVHVLTESRATGTEVPRGFAHRAGIQAQQDAARRGSEDVLMGRDGERGIRFPTLKADHADEIFEPRAIIEMASGVGVGQTRQVEHLAGQSQGQLAHI